MTLATLQALLLHWALKWSGKNVFLHVFCLKPPHNQTHIGSTSGPQFDIISGAPGMTSCCRPPKNHERRPQRYQITWKPNSKSERKLRQFETKWKRNSKSQSEAPAELNQMVTQLQIPNSNTKSNGTQLEISKGSSSNIKPNGISTPNLKAKLQQHVIKWKLTSKSQKEAPAI